MLDNVRLWTLGGHFRGHLPTSLWLISLATMPTGNATKWQFILLGVAGENDADPLRMSTRRAMDTGGRG